MNMLRVLENGEVRRLGDLSSRRASVRLIAATHRNLSAEVDAGRFRLDLFHRIRGLVVHLRPLRERPGDIPLLAARFLAQGGTPLALSSEAMAGLLTHSWPGNVRELRATLLRAAQLSRAIGLSSIPAELLRPAAAPGGEGFRLLDEDRFGSGEPAAVADADGAEAPPDGRWGSAGAEAEAPFAGAAEAPAPAGSTGGWPELPAGGLEAHLESIERRYILRALDAHGWNRTRAARSLGDMSRTTLLSKMKRLGITAQEEADDAPLEAGHAPAGAGQGEADRSPIRQGVSAPR
jgi:DNA-binding NtrC family response regulator